MKMAVSLPDNQGEALRTLAKDVADGNESLVVSAALGQFLTMDRSRQRAMVMRHKAERGTLARSAWIKLFWTWLGESLNVPEWNPNSYAPRQFGDFVVVLLLNDVARYPEEHEDFYIHVYENMAPLRHNWIFPRNDSPARCAEEVATFILNQRADSVKDRDVVERRAKALIEVLSIRHHLSPEKDAAALADLARKHDEYDFLPDDDVMLRSAAMNAAVAMLSRD